MTLPTGARYFSDAELVAICQGVIRGYGDDGAPEDDICRIVAWCESQRVGAAFVKLLIDGEVVVKLRDDGELEWRAEKGPTLHETAEFVRHATATTAAPDDEQERPQ